MKILLKENQVLINKAIAMSSQFSYTIRVGLELELQYAASLTVNYQLESKKFRVVIIIFSVDSESVLKFLFKGSGEKIEILTFPLKV